MSATLPPVLLIALVALHLGGPALGYFLVSELRARRVEALAQCGLLWGFCVTALDLYQLMPALWWPGATDHMAIATTTLLEIVAASAALDGLGRLVRRVATRVAKP